MASEDLEHFKLNPPFKYGLRHFGNAVRTIGGSVVGANTPSCCLGRVSDLEAGRPVTNAGLRAYYKSPDAPPAEYLTYVPADGPKAYKKMISAMGEWGAMAGWRGYFNLINFSHATQGGQRRVSFHRAHGGGPAVHGGPVQRHPRPSWSSCGRGHVGGKWPNSCSSRAGRTHF